MYSGNMFILLCSNIRIVYIKKEEDKDRWSWNPPHAPVMSNERVCDDNIKHFNTQVDIFNNRIE